MNTTAGAAKKLRGIMDTAIGNYPHSKDIIEAFRPVLMEKARLVDGMESKMDAPLVLDEVQFKAGVPFNAQNDLFLKDDPWDNIALSLIPTIMKGFPTLKIDLERLKELIKKGCINISEYITATPEQGQEIMKTWTVDHAVAVEAATFLAHMTSRVILEKRVRDWAGLIRDFTWDKGYCPMCGSAPLIAKIAEGKGTRWLHCPQCSHEWIFSRVLCPSCDNTDQKAMDYFFIEGNEQESTFVCKQCMHYLITLNKLSDLVEYHGEITALSLVHLDVLMQEKGYLPMASTEWNTFSNS
jgi:FdhE protein